MNRLLKITPLLALLGAMYGTAAYAATVQLPQTGQTGCWNAVGEAIDCAGTGQDGAKQAGVPLPSARFTDNNDGTVTDNLTGLIWLKDAGCFDTVGEVAKGSSVSTSKITWANALTWSNNLATDKCGLSDGSAVGDWRLPNITELESLVDLSGTTSVLSSGHPFSNVYPGYYWSSSSYIFSNSNAWLVHMSTGIVSGNQGVTGANGAAKSTQHYVWPVRTGR